MRSLVVYESSFGNTQRIARTVADALAVEGAVELISVDDDLPSLDEFDLLVAGAPTHMHGLSSRLSRKAALGHQGRSGRVGIGVHGWLDELPLLGMPAVAVFDTRPHKAEALVGSAAQGIVKRLRRRGYRLAAEPRSFFVERAPGQLEDGEPERAQEWGRALANGVLSPAA